MAATKSAAGWICLLSMLPAILQAQNTSELHDRLLTLDEAVFGSFNRCDEPGQLELHGSYFSEDLEFYHDGGGLTTSRDEMLAANERNICGQVHRELIPGTFQVFPIPEFGAIVKGQHRFCEIGAQGCQGLAEFVIVWQNQGDQWLITRVLSFDHRAIEQPGQDEKSAK